LITWALGSSGNRPNDQEYIEVNNVVIRNFSCPTGSCMGIRTYSGTVTVGSHGMGGMLVATVGSPFINQYTLFSYMTITGITPGTVNNAATCAPPNTPPASSCGPTSAPTEGPPTPAPTPAPTSAPTPPTPAPTPGPTSAPTPPTSSPTSSPTTANNNNGLSGGAIAGIVIGVLFGLLLILAILFALFRYSKKKTTESV